MPHIHEAIDLTVAAYVVYENKILMVRHKKLHKWLPPGGHVELDQDPEEALYMELKEETGLQPHQLTILGNKPAITSPGTKFLHAPTFLDIHEISPTHRHIGMTYIVKANTEEVRLSAIEHHDIRWFTLKELNDEEYDILPAVKYYATKALEQIQK